MKTEEEEGLSAYLDGELDAGRAAGLTRRILSEPRLQGKLARYGLIGESFRQNLVDVPIVDVADAVRRRLESEPTVLAPAARQKRRWLQPVAGAALAASVAIFAILLVPRLANEQAAPDRSAPLAAAPPAMAVGAGVQVAASVGPPGRARDAAARSMTPQMAERLSHYLVEHHEFTGRSGLQGPVPLASFVSYDGR